MALLQANKPVAINRVEGATVPDAVGKIGNIKLEVDGTLTYAIHYFLNEADAIANTDPISFETFNMNIPNLENQILTHAKTQPTLDIATEI